MPCDKSKEERFEEIYYQYHNEVYRISLYYTKNEYEAQDITQKVFYKLYQHFDKINLECARSYLFRAARNLSYNWIRDSRKELEGKCIDEVSEEGMTTHSVEEYFVHEEERKQKKEFLSALMDRLYTENVMWYNILNLIYCLEMSHDEVAETLGISKTVLYSKLYRAKQWLHKNYGDKYKEL